MNKEELCKKVLSLDSRIRFAGLINEKGRLIAGGMKPELKSLEEPRDNEMLYLELVLKVKMRKEFDKAYGPVKFALAYREKVIIMSFSVTKDILLISAEKEVDFSKLPFKILEIIRAEN